MFDKNLKKLFIQYKTSRGINDLSFDDLSTRLDFLAWLKNMKLQIEKYRLFLKKYQIYNSFNKILEFGKSPYDTISNNAEYMLLLTQYANLFNRMKINSFGEVIDSKNLEDSRTIVNGKIIFGDEDYVCLKNNGMRRITISSFDYFLTQNPYSKLDIEKLKEVYSHDYDVCLGMFGKKSDCDYSKKNSLLETFEQYTNGKLRIQEDDDIYLGLVYTDNRKKRRF